MSEPVPSASATCASCGRETSPPPPPETPCPTCGTPSSIAPLEVDATWAAEKAATIAAGEAKPKKRSSAYLILTLVLIAMAGVFVVMVMQRSPTARGAASPTDGIEITVTSSPHPGVPITVDGAPAGRTPASLRIKGRTKAMRIEGNGTFLIVEPDRDQIVNLAKPKNAEN